jgi:phenylacetate-CoA ligase
MFHKLVFKLGSSSRNSSLASVFEELKKTEFASRESLSHLQKERLNTLLKFSYDHSVYYKDVFDKYDIDPYKQEYEVADLVYFPLLKKEQLLKYGHDIHTINSFRFEKLFYSETSGSTGQALTFYKDESWDSYNRASINRGLSWYGVQPWDRNGYFWGYNFNRLQMLKTSALDFLVNRFRLFSYSDKQLNVFLNKCKGATYLEGYSSMIYEVAKLANKKGVRLHNIKMIKGTSEKIYSHYNEETLRAFGKKITSEYGSAESGIIAFECPEGKMHLNEETCIVEDIDNKVIVTNLVGKSFPTIRYELGDYIKLSDEKCKCGRAHRVLEEITGRVGKNIVGLSNKNYPSLTLYYVFKNMALNHEVKISYRCLQKEVGKLEVYMEQDLNQKSLHLLKDEFRRYFNQDLVCDYIYVDSIHQNNKKLKDFESEL